MILTKMAVDAFYSAAGTIMAVFGFLVVAILLTYRINKTFEGYDMNELRKRATPVLKKIVKARASKLESIREQCTNQMERGLPVPKTRAQLLIDRYNDGYQLDSFLEQGPPVPKFPLQNYYYTPTKYEYIDVLGAPI